MMMQTPWWRCMFDDDYLLTHIVTLMMTCLDLAAILIKSRDWWSAIGALCWLDCEQHLWWTVWAVLTNKRSSDQRIICSRRWPAVVMMKRQPTVLNTWADEQDDWCSANHIMMSSVTAELMWWAVLMMSRWAWAETVDSRLKRQVIDELMWQ